MPVVKKLRPWGCKRLTLRLLLVLGTNFITLECLGVTVVGTELGSGGTVGVGRDGLGVVLLGALRPS